MAVAAASHCCLLLNIEQTNSPLPVLLLLSAASYDSLDTRTGCAACKRQLTAVRVAVCLCALCLCFLCVRGVYVFSDVENDGTKGERKKKEEENPRLTSRK